MNVVCVLERVAFVHLNISDGYCACSLNGGEHAREKVECVGTGIMGAILNCTGTTRCIQRGFGPHRARAHSHPCICSLTLLLYCCSIGAEKLDGTGLVVMALNYLLCTRLIIVQTEFIPAQQLFTCLACPSSKEACLTLLFLIFTTIL